MAEAHNQKGRKRRMTLRRKKFLDQNTVIDYRYPDVLSRFVTERGKIIPRRISGATSKQQDKITIAVKRARYLSLIPLSVHHRTEHGFSGDMSSVTSVSYRDNRSRYNNSGSDRKFDKGPRKDFSEKKSTVAETKESSKSVSESKS